MPVQTFDLLFLPTHSPVIMTPPYSVWVRAVTVIGGYYGFGYIYDYGYGVTREGLTASPEGRRCRIARG
eukprot:74805-Amorphochlora_amoeboformis.AAC.4